MRGFSSEMAALAGMAYRDIGSDAASVILCFSSRPTS
ncbi:unnamed protein product [Brugia timori]|uniref:PPM-type phosphatase domain-containing protein n=1 Tax=Brugia timori TaxID=42155 RepID=A0A0R3QHR6_9BILA|nr:unnamed protein product [Brugia timori]